MVMESLESWTVLMPHGVGIEIKTMLILFMIKLILSNLFQTIKDKYNILEMEKF